MNPRTKAILLLLLTGLLWSMGGVFVKVNDANPFVISSMRGLVAAIVFFIVLKGRPKITWSKPQVIGAIAYSGVLTSFVLSTTLTSAANAILLEYTAPVFVAILAWFILKERLQIYDILAIVGVGVGMWLLMSNSLSSGHTLGNVIGAGSGVAYAVFVICLRFQKDASPYETVFLGNIFTFLIGLPFFFIAPPQPVSMLPIVFLGVFQIAIPYLLLTYASKKAKAIDIALFTILEPVLNPVWVFLFTGEDPGVRAVIGGAVLIGVVIMKSVVVLRPKKRKTIHVAAAIILKDAHILATQRGYGNYAGFWEFPGGKIESHETAEEALHREIKEELKVEIQIDSHLIDVEYDYPEFHLKMKCYFCSLKEDNEIELQEHRDAVWLNKEELFSVEWLGADIEVLKAIEKKI